LFDLVEPDVLTMYTTSWCGYCVRLKRGLDDAGINYREINIERDENAAFRVMEVNGGNQTVPTIEFGDGSALTNPSVAQIQQHLVSLN
jgi:mycoredoxin